MTGASYSATNIYDHKSSFFVHLLLQPSDGLDKLHQPGLKLQESLVLLLLLHGELLHLA